MHSFSISAEHRLRVSESRAPGKIHVFALKEEKDSKVKFYVCVTVHRNKFLCNEIDTPVSQIYFVMKLYMFRTVRLSVIRSLFTLHSAVVYVTQVCRHIPLLSVQ